MSFRARGRQRAAINQAEVRKTAKLYACVYEGGKAHDAGMARAACPYPDERRAKLWDQGWMYRWEITND